VWSAWIPLCAGSPLWKQALSFLVIMILAVLLTKEPLVFLRLEAYKQSAWSGVSKATAGEFRQLLGCAPALFAWSALVCHTPCTALNALQGMELCDKILKRGLVEPFFQKPVGRWVRNVAFLAWTNLCMKCTRVLSWNNSLSRAQKGKGSLNTFYMTEG